MKNLLYVISLLTLFACTDKEKSSRANPADPVEATVPAGSTKSVDVPQKPASKSGPAASKWRYEKTMDKEGRTIYKASITSPTPLEFGFPYAGGSTATLTIRKRDTGTTVYLQVSKGQFNRSFQGGSARIRFDQNPPATYSFSAAENGSANIIFFDAAEKLINKMKQAKKMSVDVEFYTQGNRQIEFRTADLTWRH